MKKNEILEKNNEEDKKKTYFFDQRKFSEPAMISKGNKSGFYQIFHLLQIFLLKKNIFIFKKGKAQSIIIF